MQKNDSNLPLIGGITAAIGAGLCCVGPFLLLSLGIGGA
ncbi:MAG: mercury transporter, partial [Thalassolituus sp. CG17_big_fil_post_rev_8_21_14_2_50_53_8]